MHILDIVENSIAADARFIEIRMSEDTRKDLEILEIKDDGRGMDEETAGRALDPFFTTKKTRRFGLGLSMLRGSARAAGGDFLLDSKPGWGTRVKAAFQASHIDKKPQGDIAQTLLTLIMGHPEIRYRYEHIVDEEEFILDTDEIHSRLDGAPIHSPEVIRIIKSHIKEGLANLRRKK